MSAIKEHITHIEEDMRIVIEAINIFKTPHRLKAVKGLITVRAAIDESVELSLQTLNIQGALKC